MSDTETLLRVLDTPVEGDHPGLLRDYLCALLLKLCADGSEFSGKRPFGNSSWEYDLYIGLIKGGLVEGELDEDGYVEEVDTAAADALIAEAIRHIFKVGHGE